MADVEIPLPIVGQDVVKDAPLPEPWGVLLAHPNPDGSRKSCVNCMMWARTDQCAIHDPDLIIEADHICGYHVFGTPMEVMPTRPSIHDQPNIQYVDPDYSGLDSVPGGTSCDLCMYYEPIGENYEADGVEGGLCHQISALDENPPAPVGPLMCCAAWDDGSEPETLEPENPEPVETPPMPDSEGNPY